MNLSKKILIAASLFAAFTGCGRSDSRQLTPVQEAYRLMDQGDNSKAILVLEQETRDNPSNVEAHELLGSAYVGLAGIDVYAIYDSFQDVLFRRSLKDEVQGKGPSAPSATPESFKEDVTGGEKLFQKLDRSLSDVQRIAIYLARFPQIPKEKWPFLDKALLELERSTTSSKAAVYRIVVRLIYTKSFLVEEVMQDPEFGTKKWACTFDPDSLSSGLKFLNGQIESMRTDVTLAVSLGAKKMANADSVLADVLSATNLAEAAIALENSRTVQEAETRLRARLGCEKI